jgi:hypothetical protein
MVDVISRRPIEFSVANTGNIREFLLELSANAAMTWNFDRYQSESLPQGFLRPILRRRQRGNRGGGVSRFLPKLLDTEEAVFRSMTTGAGTWRCWKECSRAGRRALEVEKSG